MVEVKILIPARKKSRRISKKNMLFLNGKRMINYAIEAALNSLHETWVISDDRVLRKHCEINWRKSLSIMKEPKRLAGDKNQLEEVMEYFLKKAPYIIPPDILILIEPTSPLITSQDINGALSTFLNGNYDSLLSVQRRNHFTWYIDEDHVHPINYNPCKRPMMQDFDGFLIEEGGIYITSVNSFLKTKCRLSGRIGYYLIEHPSIDVDDEVDFKIAEALLGIRDGRDRD